MWDFAMIQYHEMRRTWRTAGAFEEREGAFFDSKTPGQSTRNYAYEPKRDADSMFLREKGLIYRYRAQTLEYACLARHAHTKHSSRITRQ